MRIRRKPEATNPTDEACATFRRYRRFCPRAFAFVPTSPDRPRVYLQPLRRDLPAGLVDRSSDRPVNLVACLLGLEVPEAREVGQHFR